MEGRHYVAPGLLVLCNRGCKFVPTLSSACGSRERLVTVCSCFPVNCSPPRGHKLGRTKQESGLRRSQACAANGAMWANGVDFLLSTCIFILSIEEQRPLSWQNLIYHFFISVHSFMHHVRNLYMPRVHAFFSSVFLTIFYFVLL